MPGARIESGERVTLRTLEHEDIPFVQRAYANPEIRYPGGVPLRNQEQLEDWHEENSGDQFLVCLDEDHADPGQPNEDDVRPIGAISLKDADWRRPELSYWLVPEVHGEGYGQEAVSLVIEYVFRVYATPAVGARVYDFNDASRGLLKSLGFTKEGCMRKDRFVDGEYRDTFQYGLLRQEWQNRK
ncbi:GNAT family N-acetyltransferase [Natrialba asiatica]|uniref:Protein N-acetyltransferase-like protein n=1 Tax=Natrialba asiatica (strain ATCC 700177 / DSM 12278 / JCM 9576 / FERM P-10747 / NBRC 102637 / 172P1) TaxID=29540 RepID=M0B3I6_NATA1|nr:GNAT family protein [Natrialba asiatica]ELZ05461.1 protein N-acetyltransferase-like protein [Natrialba asiatica DSM 12278]